MARGIYKRTSKMYESRRGNIPWNKKYPDKWKCETCGKMFKHKGHKRRFCSPKCWGKSKLGCIPWNKGKKGLQSWHNTKGLIKAKKGNTQGFQKGVIPKTAFKKGNKPWNYIDGRSKLKTTDRYGDDWDKIRRLVYERDNYTCQRCGKLMRNSKIAFHVHHIVPFLESFDNSLSNLTTLCPNCHSSVECNYLKRLIKEEKSGTKGKK